MNSTRDEPPDETDNAKGKELLEVEDSYLVTENQKEMSFEDVKKEPHNAKEPALQPIAQEFTSVGKKYKTESKNETYLMED